jgi:hypothetical protein
VIETITALDMLRKGRPCNRVGRRRHSRVSTWERIVVDLAPEKRRALPLAS